MYNVGFRIDEPLVEREDLSSDSPSGVPRILTELQMARGYGPAMDIDLDTLVIHTAELFPCRMFGIFSQ